MIVKIPEYLKNIFCKYLFILSPSIAFFIIELSNYSYRAHELKIPLIWVPLAAIFITMTIDIILEKIIKANIPILISIAIYSICLFIYGIYNVIYIPMFFNYVILLSIQAIFLLIFRRINVSINITVILSSALSILNFYLVKFRGFQVPWSDIKATKTALNVLDNYDYSLSSEQIVVVIIMLCTVLLATIFTRKKIKLDAINMMLSGTAIILYFLIILNTSILSNYGIRQDSYFENPNGFVLNAIITYELYDLKLPSNYSIEKIEEINNSIPPDINNSGIQPVNIIAIMNESFSDLPYSGLIDINNINGLTENTIKGTAYTSVIGYNTSNSEYEFLTNNSMAFMHNQLAPFMTDYITERTHSIVDILNRNDYETIAFHNYWSTGWNRVETYERLKFNKQVFLEDISYNSEEFYNNWPSDKLSYEQIIKFHKQKGQNKKIFIHNVTMQNHSPNPNFIESIEQSDEDIMILIDYFKEIDEPTMIVFYGDHQLAMDNEFYKKYLGGTLGELSNKELEEIYTVPFFIWANYDIPEQTDIKLSLNYLSILMLDTANIPLTKYQILQKELFNTVPIIHGTGYWTNDEYYPTFESLPDNIRSQVNKYKLVQLHNMLDTDNLIYELFINSKKQ